MVLAGVSNFGFKIAAKKGFDAETFTFYGGVSSLVFAGLGLLMFSPLEVSTLFVVIITVISGFLAAQAGVLKVFALRYIDTTIFFPLFKLLSPFIAVAFGLVVFGERFTMLEWLGIALGHIVPILLINKIENKRQNNLVKGLILVVLVSGASALTAALNKYAMINGMSEWTTLWYMSWGIFIGALILLSIKLRSLPFAHVRQHTSTDLVKAAVFRSTLICLSMLCVLYAYANGGDLGIVQTIHALYIVIPIILSVLIYKEHIDLKKVIAVLLCIATLAFLG
jgi:drug/metabolite transporter (DMT)-like permease